MKVLVFASVVAVACAQYRGFGQEQDGPYQPSGWRPSGPSFALPARQQLPRVTYGTPQQEYGPPETTTTEAQPTTAELPTTTESVPETEQIRENQVKENDKLSDGNVGAVEEGVYYIYHPTGLLQRVVYSTRDDARNMAYIAQLKYQNVEPIREPIYTYDPQTFVFRRLQI